MNLFDVQACNYLGSMKTNHGMGTTRASKMTFCGICISF